MKHKDHTTTEAEVVAYLTASARFLLEQSGQSLGSVEIIASAYGRECTDKVEVKFRAYADTVGANTDSPTLEAAINAVIDRSGPKHIAANLRAQAAALIAKADTIFSTESEATTEARNRSSAFPVNHHD